MSDAETLAAQAPSGFTALLTVDQSVLDCIPAALSICSADGLLVRFNRRAAELWGRNPRAGDIEERFCGALRHYRLDGTPLDRASTPVETVLRTGEPQIGKELIIERPDGSRVSVLANIEPLKNSFGTIQGAITCFQDITDRIRAEEAHRRAEEELRRNEERERERVAELEAIMEAVPAVIWIARDKDCQVITGNRMSYEFLRLSTTEVNASLSAGTVERPTHFDVLVDGRVLAPQELPVQRAARGEDVRNFEEEVRFDDGSSRYLLGNATPLRDADGRSCGAVAAFVDITDRRKAEEQRDLLVAELSHRVKNTLATVISIAQQSFANTLSSEDARRSFNARIRALAQTHGRLAETNWSGVPFETILLDEFAPYRREDGVNVHIAGPPIVLNPKYALTLGLAMHELTTNAAKYGALSTGTGTVSVLWHNDAVDRQLRILWTERGGPTVGRPARRGFGRLLLERALASDLRGNVRLDFAPDGLTCAIAIPMDELVGRLV